MFKCLFDCFQQETYITQAGPAGGGPFHVRSIPLAKRATFSAPPPTPSPSCPISLLNVFVCIDFCAFSELKNTIETQVNELKSQIESKCVMQ